MILDIIDDALPHYAQESIKNIILRPDFPWYYRDRTVEDLPPSRNKHQFIHSLWYNDTSRHPNLGAGNSRCYHKSHHFENVMGLFSFLPEFQTHSLNRVQFNLNTPYKRRYIDNMIHTDNEDPHSITYLYYCIDSDGPTTFYGKWRKRRVHPKQGRMVRFSSNTRHSINIPFKYEKRIVLNIVFQPGTLQ